MKVSDRDRPAPTDSAGPHRVQLSGSVLHDLRTPLNQIIGYSELLAEQAEEDGLLAFATDLNRIRTSGKKLLSLINENFDASANPGASAAMPHQPDKVVDDGAASRPVGLATAVPESTIPTAVATGSILVVDDSEQNRDVLSKRLVRQGHEVVAVAGGLEALSALRSRSFDLVLLDIMMPDMDGYEVLNLLKSDSALSSIPVVMISALSEVDGIARCIESGADDYLRKPFDAILLQARVLSCLEKKRAHDREMTLFDQLQQNYKRLQVLERQRDDLTNMIVHDLRTPLTSVIGGLRTLGLLGELNIDQQEIMDLSISGGDVLLGMISDLLDVEKLASGTMQLDLAQVSIPEIVASSIAQVSNLAENRNLSICCDLAEYLPTVRADVSKLRRVIVNLLGNAIKFTPPNGRVTVAANPGPDNESIEISVSDTGEGIPTDALETIFEKFVQVETRSGGRTMSTGLGLAFCKLAVEAHRGRITASSDIGNGSTFTFTLPCEKSRAEG